AAANPAGASWLQSSRRVRRVAELGSLGDTPWPNSRSYEENTKRPVLVGRIRLVPDGLVHRLPKHADANRSRIKKSPGLLARRRAGRQHLNKHHGQLAQLLCATGPVV